MQLIPRDYLGAAAPFVSIGRGAAPSGRRLRAEAVGAPGFRGHSRRFSEIGAAPAYALRDSGLASRRRESDGGGAPSLPSGERGRFGAAAPFVSIGRGAAPSGPLTSGDHVARFSEMGAWPSLRAVWVHKKEGLLPAPR